MEEFLQALAQALTDEGFWIYLDRATVVATIFRTIPRAGESQTHATLILSQAFSLMTDHPDFICNIWVLNFDTIILIVPNVQRSDFDLREPDSLDQLLTEIGKLGKLPSAIARNAPQIHKLWNNPCSSKP